MPQSQDSRTTHLGSAVSRKFVSFFVGVLLPLRTSENFKGRPLLPDSGSPFLAMLQPSTLRNLIYL